MGTRSSKRPEWLRQRDWCPRHDRRTEPVTRICARCLQEHLNHEPTENPTRIQQDAHRSP